MTKPVKPFKAKAYKFEFTITPQSGSWFRFRIAHTWTSKVAEVWLKGRVLRRLRHWLNDEVFGGEE